MNWTLVLVAAVVLTRVAGPTRWTTTPWRPDQCELLRFDQPALEFQNTWSNLAYMALGLLILYRRPRLLGVMVGMNLALVSLFSGWYHSTLLPLAQAFDVGWIYAVILSMLAYAVEALVIHYQGRQLNRRAMLPLAIAPTLFGLVVSIVKANGAWRADSTKLTLALLGFLTVPVLLKLRDLDARPRIWFTCGIAAPALLAAVCRFGDGRGHPLCNPTALVQAHALWHVLGAAALAVAYVLLAKSTSARGASTRPATPQPVRSA